MKARFHLYVREHRTGWMTAQVLTLPAYTGFGPHLGQLKDELSAALQDDLSSGDLEFSGPEEHWFDGLRSCRVDLTIRAVQHQRLVEVPMRFLLALRRVSRSDDDPSVQVFIPRIGQELTVRGEPAALNWAEEIIRGWFHLDPVSELLKHQYERSERLDILEFTFTEPTRRRQIKSRFSAGGEEASHPLAAYGLNRLDEAVKGRAPRPRFRDEEVGQLVEILASRQSPCALLVGPSGVGKTAVVDGLAYRIAQGRVPPRLSGSSVWTIPGTRWLAGARFLGEWQARAQEIVRLLDGENAILHLGPLSELLAARGQEASLSPAQFLLPIMASGALPIVAEATEEGITLAERSAPALLRAFQRVPLKPLATNHQAAILSQEAKRLETLHKVTIEPAAVDAALDIIARFRDAKTLPGAGMSLLEQMARNAAAPKATPDRTVRPAAAMEAFCQQSGYPRAVVDPEVRLVPSEVRSFFETKVLGQPEAARYMASLVFLVKAGLAAPDKPLGSFLFAGPTGVGKTETALALAEFLFGDRKRLSRLDMSEYAYPGAALRLVDGQNGEGDLTRLVRAQPFGIVLLDEIEKADGGVFDLLLQVLGEGRLSDGAGRTVAFQQCIIILTSNLGATNKPPMGFEDEEYAGRSYLEAVEGFFRPELVNRIDQIVAFLPLEATTLRILAERLLDAALQREGFERRGIRVRYEAPLIEALLERGYQPKYGARPLKRAVESEVVAPLARLLSGWPGPEGAEVTLSWDGKLEIDFAEEPVSSARKSEGT